jgi:hypothetical protein
MFDFIRQLFTSWDRQTKATDRAATALEGIADDLEAVRTALRERLAGKAEEVPLIGSKPEAQKGNGRKTVKVS